MCVGLYFYLSESLYNFINLALFRKKERLAKVISGTDGCSRLGNYFLLYQTYTRQNFGPGVIQPFLDKLAEQKALISLTT